MMLAVTMTATPMKDVLSQFYIISRDDLYLGNVSIRM